MYLSVLRYILLYETEEYEVTKLLWTIWNWALELWASICLYNASYYAVQDLGKERLPEPDHRIFPLAFNPEFRAAILHGKGRK